MPKLRRTGSPGIPGIPGAPGFPCEGERDKNSLTLKTTMTGIKWQPVRDGRKTHRGASGTWRSGDAKVSLEDSVAELKGRVTTA